MTRLAVEEGREKTGDLQISVYHSVTSEGYSRRLVFPEDIFEGESPTDMEALLALLCLLLGDSISISNFILLILTLSGVPIS